MGNSEFNNKVALITGANKGLGFEMSRQLAQYGLTVLIAARKLEVAEAAATTLRNEGLKAEAIALDVNDRTQIQAAVEEIQARFGKLDVLINNAGVMLDGEWSISNASSVSIDIIRQTFETNFLALLNQRWIMTLKPFQFVLNPLQNQQRPQNLVTNPDTFICQYQ